MRHSRFTDRCARLQIQLLRLSAGWLWFGWDELAFAVFVGGAEGVAAVGDEVVVVATDSPEVEDARLTIRSNCNDVVPFEAFGAMTACDDACGVAVGECGFEFGGNAAAVVTDGTDIYAFGDQNF